MNFAVEHGYFGYGNREILRNVSFALQGNEVLAVLGPNGIGKTTLLRCMMGLLKWKRGSTLIDGMPISTMTHRQLWSRIAYVPQSKGSAMSYTALEMVLMGRSAHMGLFAQPSQSDYEAAQEAMELVGISHLAEKKCNQISGGELQMILIARALSAHPELLVLDEPESNLDFKNQLIILDTIQRLSREKGIGAIVNTHYPAHALKISDRALIFNPSGDCIFGPSQQVINEENLRDSFDVHVKIQEYRLGTECYKSVIPIAVV